MAKFVQIFVCISLLLSVCIAKKALKKSTEDLLASGQEEMMKSMSEIYENFGAITDLLESNLPDCDFECPNEGYPIKNESHVPSSNGCGAYGINVTDETLPVAEMTQCCDAHDICYDTCNKDKGACDSIFKKCLLKKCSEKSHTMTGEELKGCNIAGNILYATSATLGCLAYKEAQSNACHCKEIPKIESKSKANSKSKVDPSKTKSKVSSEGTKVNANAEEAPKLTKEKRSTKTEKTTKSKVDSTTKSKETSKSKINTESSGGSKVKAEKSKPKSTQTTEDNKRKSKSKKDEL